MPLPIPTRSIFVQPMVSGCFEAKFELSKPRHMLYVPSEDPIILQEEILAVDDTQLLYYVNQSPSNSGQLPILNLLNELMVNEVYLNMKLILFDKSGAVLWIKEKNGFIIGDISFSTDYRSTDCLLARATLHSTSYSQTTHTGNKTIV